VCVGGLFCEDVGEDFLVAGEDGFPAEEFGALADAAAFGRDGIWIILRPAEFGGEIFDGVVGVEGDAGIGEDFAGGGAIVVEDAFAHAELVEEDEAGGLDGGGHDEGAGVLAELDVGVGEAESGEDDAVGGEFAEESAVGVLVGVGPHQHERERVFQKAVGAEEEFGFVLGGEARDIEKVLVGLEAPFFEFAAVDGGVADGEAVGEVLGAFAVVVEVAVGDGGVVGDDAVAELHGPVFAFFEPPAGEAVPLFAAEVGAVDIDDDAHSGGFGEAGEDGVADAAEVDDVVAPPHGVKHREEGVDDGVEAFGGDGVEPDDVHSLPGFFGVLEAGQAVVNGDVVAERGEAGAEFLDDDFEARVARGDAARAEEGDGGKVGGRRFLLDALGRPQKGVAGGVVDEKGVEAGVAAPKAVGLLEQAVGPGGAGALHPLGGEGALACEQGEGVADGEEHAALVTVEVADDPFLLAFAAERDPDKIGSGLRDGEGKGRFLLFGPIAEWRAESANDVEAGVGFFEFFGKGVEGPGGAAKEKVFPGRGGGREKPLHEVGSVNTVVEACALSVEHPAERHSIGEDEVEAPHGVAEGGCVAGERDDVGVARGDGGGTRLAGQSLALGDGGGVVHNGHRRAEDGEFLDGGRWVFQGDYLKRINQPVRCDRCVAVRKKEKKVSHGGTANTAF